MQTRLQGSYALGLYGLHKDIDIWYGHSLPLTFLQQVQSTIRSFTARLQLIMT